MMVSVPKIQRPSVKDRRLVVDVPNLCPHCGLFGHPDVLVGVTDDEGARVGFVIKCPNLDCGELYYASYSVKIIDDFVFHFPDDHEAFTLALTETCPTLVGDVLPKGIEKIYPKFVDLFSQAERAELARINDAVGMLYRKALESLVKDYLTKQSPNEKQDILGETLGKSIQRINYPMLQELARASSWIGNDAVHLTSKNPEYTVKDMKAYIVSLCHLIMAEQSALSAMKLTKGKKVTRR